MVLGDTRVDTSGRGTEVGSIYAASLYVIKLAGVGTAFVLGASVPFPISKPNKFIDSLNWNWIPPFIVS